MAVVGGQREVRRTLSATWVDLSVLCFEGARIAPLVYKEVQMIYDAGMISKIQKAKRYAQEVDRISFRSFEVTFRGDHDTYTVSYDQGQWSCQCNFFASRGVCSHTMTMERVLSGILPLPSEIPAS